jgi:UDP-glucuronate decarboxylase
MDLKVQASMRNGSKNGSTKTALVAGGAGFLGSHLCDALLARGMQVICLDNFMTGRRENIEHLERESRFDVIEADVVNPLPARLRTLQLDQIWNLACPASPPTYQVDPEHTLLTSVIGTHGMLKLAEHSGARFFLASTSEVYGDPKVHPQREDYWGHVNPTGPRACYDEGKRAAETLTFDFDRARRAEVRVVRIFNTYGPRLNAEDGRVVSNVINQALSGQDITVYGDGGQTRSFCYVDDLIDGMVRLMNYEGAQPGPVNLGNPVEMSVNDLVHRVVAMTGSRSRIVARPLPTDDPQRRRPDISRAAELLGWEPKTPVDKGLRATIAWYKAEHERARPANDFPTAARAALA